MSKFYVFISERSSGGGAGGEMVSASDHQAAVEAVALRVETGFFDWATVRNVDNSGNPIDEGKTYIMPSPK